VSSRVHGWLFDPGSIYKSTSGRLADSSVQQRFLALAADIGRHWPELPLARKRAVLTALIERIEVRFDQIDIHLHPLRLGALLDLPAPPSQGVNDDEIELLSGERWFAAELNRHKGQLLLRQAQSEAAEEFYRKALSIAEEQGAKLWELRAAMSLARLRRDQGHRAEARDLLAPGDTLASGWSSSCDHRRPRRQGSRRGRAPGARRRYR
jgi:hypothetical protein